MNGLLVPAAIAVACVALTAALFEARTAWRLSRLRRRQDAEDKGPFETSAVVEIEDALTAPLSGDRVALFSLLLIRRGVKERSASVAHFAEERPFDVVDDIGTRYRVNSKKRSVVLVGLPMSEKPLPFLPQRVAALLIQRFGRFGQQWADGYAISGRETVLKDGASVFAMVDRGEIRTLSAKPLRHLARAALMRSLRTGAVGLAAAVVYLFAR